MVLAGYARQDTLRTDAKFEIVIADDGSREETRTMIAAQRAQFAALGVAIAHVWQSHKGYFGKMAIMNRAIVAARGEYLVVADGDVVPREDFVHSHVAMARKNTFLAGADFRVGPEATKRLTIEDIRSGLAFSYQFLRSIGQERTRRSVKLWRISLLTRMMDTVNFSPARWSGSNCGAWKSDLVMVGGFDETFRAPGKDDTELGCRLRHAGVHGRHGRHNLICLHLHHGQGNYTQEGRRRNLELLKDTIKSKRTMARIGIGQIVPGDHTVTW